MRSTARMPGAEPKFFPELFRKQNIDLAGGASINTADIAVLVIALALMVALQLIVYRTKTGRAMRAVSFNLQSAKLMGINTDRIIAFTFALGSALLDWTADQVGRMGRPDEMAGPLVFLNSDEASYVNGLDLMADGGFTGAMELGLVDLSTLPST